MKFLFYVTIKFIISIAIGNYADKRGRSALGWGLFSFFISSILALILIIVLPDKLEEERRESIRRAQYIGIIRDQNNVQDINKKIVKQQQTDREIEKRKEELKQMEIVGQDIADRINKVFRLFKNNFITEEEYRQKKEEILSDIKNKIIIQDTNEFLGDLMELLDNNILSRDEIDNIKGTIIYKKKLMDMKYSELVELVNDKEDELVISEIKIRAMKQGYKTDNIQDMKASIEKNDYKLLNEYMQNRSEKLLKQLQIRNIDINEGIEKVGYIKNLSDYMLINEYINNDDEMYKEEIEIRGLKIDIEEAIKDLNNIQLIDEYRKNNDSRLKKELAKRGLNEYIEV